MIQIKPVPCLTTEEIPILETGDVLTREEFERRYDAMPNLKKAELLEGVVYMGSPVRFRKHGYPQAHLVAWGMVYASHGKGIYAADNATVRLDPLNEPQPDATLFLDQQFGGQAQIGPDDYIEGPPELVCEVSSSTVSIDLNLKFRLYRKLGIKEYVVWRVLDQAIDWFILRDEKFERLTPDEQGIYRSEVFPGLWLDSAAMIQFDLAKVLATLQQGIASQEHQEFMARISSHQKGIEA